MISSITETQHNLPSIILGGDFNLPHINWQSTTVNTNPQYGKALNDKMVEITNNSDLTQVINVPTRRQNILDLLMTTNPSLISNTEVHPGMSDHEIVIADIDLKAKTAKKKPRKVFLYEKGNMNGLKDSIDAKLSARIDHMHRHLFHSKNICPILFLTSR